MFVHCVAKEKSKSKKEKKGDKKGDVKEFPMEKGPTPSKLEPVDITWLYKVPDGKFKTEEDVIAHHGYKLEEKVSYSQTLCYHYIASFLAGCRRIWCDLLCARQKEYESGLQADGTRQRLEGLAHR